MNRYGRGQHDTLIRRMAEPEHLRQLRQQAEQIEDQKRRECENAMHEIECDRLRRQIRRAGQIPCR